MLTVRSIVTSVFVVCLALATREGMAQSLQQQLMIHPYNNTAGELRDQADALIQAGNLAESQGKYSESIESWLTAIQLYETINDQASLATVYDRLAVTYRRLGFLQETESAFRTRLALANDQRDYLGQVYASNNLGSFLLETGQSQEAEKLFFQALEIATKIKTNAGKGLSLSNLGLALVQQKRYPEAINYYQQALLLRSQSGDQGGVANTANNLGDVYLILKQYTEAESQYYLGKVTAETSLDYGNWFRALQGLTMTYFQDKNTKSAFESLNEWGNLAISQNDLHQQTLSLQFGIKMYEILGDHHNANYFRQRLSQVSP